MRYLHLFAIALFLAGAATAGACVCVTPTLKCSFKQSSAAFIGDIVSAKTENGRTDVRLQVLEVFKGDLPAGREVIVFTSAMNGHCGYGGFRAGERHIVLARYEPGTSQLWTSMCAQNQPAQSERGIQTASLLRSRAWWWRSPMSFCPRYSLVAWLRRHF